MDSLPRLEESNSFGDWLRRRRKALDWTQAELAHRVNCATATIRKIEADERKPSRELALALAEQLGVPADQRETFLQSARRAVSPEHLTLDWRAHRTTPSNLPTPLTSLINRVRDIDTVTEILMRKNVRLLTLIGPPGIGKTRLCLQVAENVLAHFSAGVWFVDLASVSDASLVLPVIAHTLGSAESGEVSPAQQLIARLESQRALLVLDNFEQVIDAAYQVTDLLKACKGLKVLITSRVPLRVYGEHEYAVSGMSLPPREATPNQLVESEAVQLFLARVHEHQPGFAITPANAVHIAKVCVRLDGVPLALELAAASLRRMSLAQLVTALNADQWLPALRTSARDLPPRQQTLYNAIAWSYSLLDAPRQTVFRQLGVFAGGFDAQAASTICAADASTLATLTDHSLLAREPARWRMLEMIREFALEQMNANERVVIEQRHARYFADRLPTTSADALERDHDNYRAALRWAIQQRDGLLAVTMCTQLSDFWETRGYLREGLGLARQVLGIAGNVELRLRMGLLSNAAHLAWNRHEFDAALELAEQAIALARTNAVEKLAGALNVLGRIFIEQGEYARAEQTLRESVSLAESQRDQFTSAVAWALLGEVALACGKLDDAFALSTRALSLMAERPDRFTAMTHTNLAEIALAHDDDTTAHDELRLALPLVHLHVRRELCFLATLAGWLITSSHACKDDVQHGVELFGAIEQYIERTGLPLSAMYRTLNATRAQIAQRRLTAREWQDAWNTGKSWTREQVASKVEMWLK